MRIPRFAYTVIVAAGAIAVPFLAAPRSAPQRQNPHVEGLFAAATECMVCHNNLRTPSGEDVSIGSDWRATMMANSSRDPYWQAGVRREIMDHPSAQEEIEYECSICHMPMSSTHAKANGGRGEIFAHLPIGSGGREEDHLAADGVSCTACHQITDQKLGTPESFTGGYVINITPSAEPRPMFGRFEVKDGHATVMRSATGFKPTEGKHIQESEVCATCHTLYTQALSPQGQVIGRLPEQVPYLEWRHSAFRTEQSCQACHMPAVAENTPLTNILGEPREGFARHVFRGGNFFMLAMLNRYRTELGVVATSREMDASIRRTTEHLQTETATVTIDRAVAAAGRIDIDVAVRNLAGHKFPTAYPSRRAWLHLRVRNAAGAIVFESGAVAPNGSIAGNDNDADPLRFEPHYTEIRQADQVQIYESIMVDAGGMPTTGLLNGVRFIKDNRLLPRGFNKAAAEADIAVQGSAAQDADFTESADRLRYSIPGPQAGGPFRVEVELRFQPISFRWADNLRRYTAAEPRRFVTYYDAMAERSSEVVARAGSTVP
jgi:hypothetical protein